jgi:hypothetical protein
VTPPRTDPSAVNEDPIRYLGGETPSAPLGTATTGEDPRHDYSLPISASEAASKLLNRKRGHRHITASQSVEQTESETIPAKRQRTDTSDLPDVSESRVNMTSNTSPHIATSVTTEMRPDGDETLLAMADTPVALIEGFGTSKPHQDSLAKP